MTQVSQTTMQIWGLLATEVGTVQKLFDGLNAINSSQAYALGRALEKRYWTDPNRRKFSYERGATR